MVEGGALDWNPHIKTKKKTSPKDDVGGKECGKKEVERSEGYGARLLVLLHRSSIVWIGANGIKLIHSLSGQPCIFL